MALTAIHDWAKELKQQTLVVYFAARDSRTSWPVRALALFVAAYALSPIDLIPDFIPVLGYLDDVVIVPFGIWLVLRLVPSEVMQASRKQALTAAQKPVSRAMAVVIVVVWLAVIGMLGLWLWSSIPT